MSNRQVWTNHKYVGRWISWTTLLAVILLCAPTLSAQNMADIRKQMGERRPAIEAMWKAGLIGENNKGFLEWGFRQATGEPNKEQVKVLQAENRDRRAVYQAIASRTDASVAEVGEQRAVQIARRADPGLWLQDAEGRWYRKQRSN